MAKPIVFEPDYVEAMRTLFEETIPFNRVLGLKIDSIRPGQVGGSLAMRPELIGSPNHQRLHGGVISASLDAMAGLAIIAAIGARHMDEPWTQRMHRFTRLGTIDLRIDYLRPGIGQSFVATAEVTRLGGRIGSTQMRLASDSGQLIATGAAAYVIS